MTWKWKAIHVIMFPEMLDLVVMMVATEEG